MQGSFFEKLRDRLLSDLKLSLEQRQHILSYQEGQLSALESYLLQTKILDPEEFTKLKGETLGVPYTHLAGRVIPHEVFEFLSSEAVENYQMLCFDREGGRVHVGMVNPEDFRAIEALEFIARKYNVEVKISIISRSSFEGALREYRTLREEVADVMDISEKSLEERFRRSAGSVSEMEAVLKEAPITKIVSVIIKHAVEGKASDIHIEPVEKKTRVRYRIDGILHSALALPRYIHAALIARVKVMANLKLDETRVPQDGRMRVLVDDREIDFRVSTMPLYESEKAVLRVLPGGTDVPTLKELGFHEQYIDIITAHLKKTHGIFLATGPTGSGKSTTLYALLSLLNKEGVNIVTLEDPIEYYMDGMNQSQVRTEVNYDFASGLRSLLRQDPNIIMVGEIRDHETAGMAVNAGLTGHLLFSTIHTNNAIGAVPRLIDMGVEPFLLSSTLNLIIAQRLTRKICLQCKTEEEVPLSLRERVAKDLEQLPKETKERYAEHLKNMHFFKGAGCSLCGESGYRGRIAIAELIQMTESLQRIIYNGYNLDDVRKELQEQGMISLQRDGFLRAIDGLTSLEEVLRVTEE